MSEQVLIDKKSTKIPPKKKLTIEIQETGKEFTHQTIHLKITLNNIVTEVDVVGPSGASLVFIDYLNRFLKSLTM